MSQFTKPSPSSRTRWVNLNSSEFFLIISPTECFYQERKHATQTPLNSLVRNNTHESKETVVLNSNNSLKRQLLTYTELHKTSIGFSNAKFKKKIFFKRPETLFPNNFDFNSSVINKRLFSKKRCVLATNLVATDLVSLSNAPPPLPFCSFTPASECRHRHQH